MCCDSAIDLCKKASINSELRGYHYGAVFGVGNKPYPETASFNHYRSCFRNEKGKRQYINCFHAERQALMKLINLCCRGYRNTKKYTITDLRRHLSKYTIFIVRTQMTPDSALECGLNHSTKREDCN